MKTLCVLSVLDAGLDQSCLPQDVQLVIIVIIIIIVVYIVLDMDCQAKYNRDKTIFSD